MENHGPSVRLRRVIGGEPIVAVYDAAIAGCESEANKTRTAETEMWRDVSQVIDEHSRMLRLLPSIIDIATTNSPLSMSIRLMATSTYNSICEE